MQILGDLFEAFGLRTTMSMAFLLLCILISLACGVRNDSESAVTPKKTEKLSPKAGAWERMKECSEQADRIAKKNKVISGNRDGNILTGAVENHYSAKFERCFLRVAYRNLDKDIDKSDMPVISYYLFDAFEEKELSECTDEKEEDWQCYIGGNRVPCKQCQEFIRERMKLGGHKIGHNAKQGRVAISRKLFKYMVRPA